MGKGEREREGKRESNMLCGPNFDLSGGAANAVITKIARFAEEERGKIGGEGKLVGKVYFFFFCRIFFFSCCC